MGNHAAQLLLCLALLLPAAAQGQRQPKPKQALAHASTNAASFSLAAQQEGSSVASPAAAVDAPTGARRLLQPGRRVDYPAETGEPGQGEPSSS